MFAIGALHGKCHSLHRSVATITDGQKTKVIIQGVGITNMENLAKGVREKKETPRDSYA